MNTDEKRRERFWRQVKRGPRCWEWTGFITPSGYGTFSYSHTRPMRAHRYAYEITNGPIPTGLVVMHTCDNTRCVRPSHLKLGTMAENLRDAREKGRRPSHELQRSCKRGHPFTADNFYRFKNGKHHQCRHCRALTRKRPYGRLIDGATPITNTARAQLKPH